jgi:hypothetical protein
MAKQTKRPEQIALDELRGSLSKVGSLLPTLSKPTASRTLTELIAVMHEIERVRENYDPIKDPGYSFDPANPDTAGKLVALALVAQDQVPLSRIARTYGSGVYAIYYKGDHPAYRRISNTETPIYVGKADPKKSGAKTAREQGPQLYGRLADHRKMIRTVGAHAVENGLADPLILDDFHCRRLVCATNAQLVAEEHLIRLFLPIWNSEVGVCWGISKHGDAATTRANKRSPWDVMHPGRRWAMHENLDDKMSPAQILTGISKHLTEVPPYKNRAVIIEKILAAFTQNAAAMPGDIVDDDELPVSENGEVGSLKK